MPDFSLERELGGSVAGVDEAGRGPWAGPVHAAAVIFPATGPPAALAARVMDSKQLSKAQREAVFPELLHAALVGEGRASVAEIDELNILNATLLAMARAVKALARLPDAALVDGNRAPALPCPVHCVVRGDARSYSIAAASIVAKVTRDKYMTGLAARHPGYSWERNFGYGTKQHRQGLARLGVTAHHRRSFKPIQMLLEESAESRA
ncbi:MAG: ribonuclease HII [Alphaproteobacteria bacterium]